ncbi:Cell division cycle protein 23-like protein [Hypsibius exemplaris]|uniref:Cell division cycle protein 23-like protein n=1 Tax=Hypsibius exemplaris TaxID=2072580 RepID=A0A1W0X2Q2_HYPEX|nr:Cell division cycle protein 23-like protein [Hypsibius exemplaris]
MAQIAGGGTASWSADAVKSDLQQACILCAKYHLNSSSQWASTALLSFKELKDAISDSRTTKNGLQEQNHRASTSRWRSPAINSTPLSVFKMPFLPPPYASSTPLVAAAREPDAQTDMLDGLLYSVSGAMILQNYKEAWMLAEEKIETVPVLRFLYYYAKYLHLLRIRSLHQSDAEASVSGDAHFVRQQEKLSQEIAGHIRRLRPTPGDGALFFLYGKLLRNLKKIDQAINTFVEAISLEPKIIESWLELADCMENRAEIVRVASQLPNHWIHQYFLGKAYGHVGLIDRAFSCYERFQRLGFAGNPDLNNAMGKLVMTTDPPNSLRFMDSARQFCSARLNDVDSYSHLLFILDDHVKMRILADDIVESGRYNAECSIALGNFYGLLGDHDKAVDNFSRALRYNPDLHHVWTLIGHEQVELKQTELAMKSYTNAIEADPKEYRAWYGLGQTMEILRAHASALYYFKRAFENCPSDTRMLLALGDTYQTLNKTSDAEMCYWRAYQVDADTVVLVRLARMFEKLGRYGRSAELYMKYTADVQAEAADSLGTSLADREDAEDLGHAYLYLSKYYLLHRLFTNAFEESQAAEIFRDCKEEAHAMQKQISRMQAEFHDNPEEYVHVEPARLGFPLWKESVVIDNDTM